MPTLTPIEDDPFAQPQRRGLTPVDHDPFAPAETTPPPPTPWGGALGTTAAWNKPADVGWGQYLLAHVQHLLDPHLNANDAVLFAQGISGGASNLIPGMRERTKQAEQETPLPQRLIDEGGGYTVGPGKLFALGRSAADLGALGGATGVLARAGAGAGEGALASGAGAAFQGGSAADIEKSALIGGAGGGFLGAIGGGLPGRGGTLPPAKTSGQLQNEAQPLWNALDSTPVRNLTTYQAIAQARANVAARFANRPSRDVASALKPLDDLEKDVVGGTMNQKAIQAAVQQIAGLAPAARAQAMAQYMARAGIPNSAPASRIISAIDDLKGNDAIGNEAAGELRKLMAQTPAAHPSGVTTTAAALASQAKEVSGRSFDVGRLETMRDVAGRPGGADVGTQARQWFKSDTAGGGQSIFPPSRAGEPSYQAWDALAAKPAPEIRMWPTSFDVRHAAAPMVTGGLAGLGLGAEQHHDPGAMVRDVLTGAALGYGAHRVLPAAWSHYVQRPAMTRAQDAAASTFATGKYQPPIKPNAPMRDALRNILFGAGAGGEFMGP